MSIKCKDTEHNFGPITAFKFFPNAKDADFWRASCKNEGCTAMFMQTIPDEIKPVKEGESFRSEKK